MAEKYTVDLIDTATREVSTHVIKVPDDTLATDAATDFASEEGDRQGAGYLVVGLRRGEEDA